MSTKTTRPLLGWTLSQVEMALSQGIITKEQAAARAADAVAHAKPQSGKARRWTALASLIASGQPVAVGAAWKAAYPRPDAPPAPPKPPVTGVSGLAGMSPEDLAKLVALAKATGLIK